jgi:hypothetical protein
MAYIDKQLKERVEKALEINRNMSLGNIFYVINMSYCADESEFIQKLRTDALKHSFESISRAVRKAKEHQEGLRDVNYYERQLKAKEVAQEMITDFNTTRIKQESFI